MTEHDRHDFATLISEALVFYRQEPSEFVLEVWWRACHRFDLADVRRALGAHLMDAERGRFAPLPADIVRHLEGTQGDRAQLAWGKTFEAMRAVGAYQSVVFDDPAIHSAVTDMGGWPTLCRTRVDELPFLHRRFCDLHRAYTARPQAGHPAVLIGDHDAANRLEGRAMQPPVIVGDPQAAARVMGAGAAGSKVQITTGQAAALALAGVVGDGLRQGA